MRHLVCVDNQASAPGGDVAEVPLELRQAVFQKKTQDELRAHSGSAGGLRLEAPIEVSDLCFALAA